ncbi:MAG TPA: FAD-dependent oxidoreductase [Gemmatimonadaceae bacterium]
MAAEVVVVGGGLVGLCAALALADRKLKVTLVAEHRPGEASPAAAGMLAPSVERASGAAHDFAVAARDRYPSYLHSLAERTGTSVPLNRLGILQVAIDQRGVKGLKKTAAATSKWLDAKELHDLEPALSHAVGAMLNPDDGAVDNAMLVTALERAVSGDKHIDRIDDAVVQVSMTERGGCSVDTRSNGIFRAAHVVVATGAWTAAIESLRFGRAVSPVRGQLVSYPTKPLRHVAYGPRGYVVPRGENTIGGSTMENVGFDARTTDAGIRKVRGAAEEICPSLAQRRPTAWAGLRPVTPDMLPLIGPDPEQPEVIYACGHSRNGVLMAPLTGDIIADLVTGTPLSHDLSQFRPDRF